GGAAAREAQPLDRPAGLLRDRVELRHRAVLVVEALNREHRAAYPRQAVLDVPGAEVRVQPDLVLAPEGPGRVAVVAAELLRQVGGLEGGPGFRDAPHAQVLDEHV